MPDTSSNPSELTAPAAQPQQIAVGDAETADAVAAACRQILEEKKSREGEDKWTDMHGYFIRKAKAGWVVMEAEYEFWIRYDRSNRFWEKNNALESLTALKENLGKAGIELLITYAPSRVQIYPEIMDETIYEILKKYDGAPVHIPTAHDDFCEAIRSAGIDVLDFTQTLLANRGKPKRATEGEWEWPVFMKGDPHWSPYGCSIAAQAVEKYISGRRWYNDTPKTAIPVSWAKQDVGDLFAQTGQDIYGPDIDTEYESLTDEQSPVLLLGDGMVSWMGGKRCFGAQLSATLGFNVAQFAQSYLYTDSPVREFAKNMPQKPFMENKRLIICNLYARHTFRDFFPDKIRGISWA
jgi:hypothetical protein